MITIRVATPDDIPFILSTWLRGLRYGCELFELIPDAIYYQRYKQVIEAILAKSEVRVATLPDDASVIVGYAVLAPDVLHWVYVKQAWRKLGVARQLVPAVRSVTHITKVGQKILSGKPIEYNPFLV